MKLIDLIKTDVDAKSEIIKSLSYRDQLSLFSASQQFRNTGNSYFVGLCKQRFGFSPPLESAKLLYGLCMRVEKLQNDILMNLFISMDDEFKAIHYELVKYIKENSGIKYLNALVRNMSSLLCQGVSKVEHEQLNGENAFTYVVKLLMGNDLQKQSNSAFLNPETYLPCQWRLLSSLCLEKTLSGPYVESSPINLNSLVLDKSSKELTAFENLLLSILFCTGLSQKLKSDKFKINYFGISNDTPIIRSNYRKAISHAKRALEQGHELAYAILGRIQLKSGKTKKNISTLEIGKKQGDSWSSFYLIHHNATNEHGKLTAWFPNIFSE